MANAKGGLTGKAVEQAAVDWVMAYERGQGRVPADKRYVRGFPGDIDSPPRVIEIKATAASYKGWFLPLEPIQLEHALEDDAFYVYVVENVGPGDPARFTLRILAGDHLKRLAANATERRSYEVPWPTADYLATPVEGAPAGMIDPPPSPTVVAGAAQDSPQNDVSMAIEEALRSLGGEADLRDIVAKIEAAHPGRWRSPETAIADLTYPGNASSHYAPEARIVERVSRGRYRLRG